MVTVESTGTMYGRPALAALREIVAAEKKHDPLAPVTVLVPNNIAGLFVRRFLARGVTDGRPGIAGIFISTLPRLAEQIGRRHAVPAHAGNGDGGGRRLALRVGRGARDLRGGRRSPGDHPRSRVRPPGTPGSLGYRTGRRSGHQPAACRTDRVAPGGHRPDRRHLLRRDRSADCGHRAGARTTRHPAAVGSHRAVPAATTQPCRDSAGSNLHSPHRRDRARRADRRHEGRRGSCRGPRGSWW